MRIDVITLFPELFETPLRTSLLGKAVDAGLLDIGVHDLREDGLGAHRSVDDSPFGGGAGMVMRPEPLFAAIERIRTEDTTVVLLSPRGEVLNHESAVGLAEIPHLLLVCGRYEGVDQRVIDALVDREVSIGDFVTAGGELPALVLIEAVSRFVPGVLGNPSSLNSESHAAGLLEYPQYTRPATFRDLKVPDVLMSGNHAEVEAWRHEQSLSLTRDRRPDLLSDE